MVQDSATLHDNAGWRPCLALVGVIGHVNLIFKGAAVGHSIWKGAGAPAVLSSSSVCKRRALALFFSSGSNAKLLFQLTASCFVV